MSTEFTLTQPRTRAWSVPLVSSMKEKPDMHHHNLAVHYTSLIYDIGWALTAVNLRHPDPDDQCHYLYTGFRELDLNQVFPIIKSAQAFIP